MPMRRKLDQSGVDLMDLPNMRSELEVPLTMEDFIDALKNIKTSVSNTSLKQYSVWMSDFG
jgi:SpoVK/Ycf46/Vps4 family AAA+-type ATPase